MINIFTATNLMLQLLYSVFQKQRIKCKKDKMKWMKKGRKGGEEKNKLQIHSHSNNFLIKSLSPAMENNYILIYFWKSVYSCH